MRLQSGPMAAGGDPLAAVFCVGERSQKQGRAAAGSVRAGLLRGSETARFLSRSDTGGCSATVQPLNRFGTRSGRKLDSLNRAATNGVEGNS